MGNISFERERETEHCILELSKDLDIDPEYYNDYEHAFIRNIARKKNPYLNDAQKRFLDRLWNKHLSR